MKKKAISTDNPAVAAVLEQARQIVANPRKPRIRKPKTPKICACGCGEQTRGGSYKPGHNGILLGRLVAEMRTKQ